MIAFRRAAAALLLFSVHAAAHADERILHYLSDVEVQKDGALEVVESIDIRAENDRINHGIFRDFPTRYTGPHGGKVRVGFKFEAATLDGSPVAADVQPYGNGVRIKVGHAATLVAVGEHNYVLRYRTTRQIGRFPGYDELYWNATGNGWIFPIDVAEARIRLPEAARFGQHAVYTGPQGSTQSNAEMVEERPGEILFRTTQPLDSYEGLTIAVAFPKGIVADPPASSRLVEWLQDYGPPLVGLFSLIGLLGFYYLAWARVGRDPRAGTVVPLFTPPDDLTPAGMRYVVKMAADNRAFAAALVDACVRGHVRLVEEDRGLLHGKQMRLERLNGADPLPPDESEALDRLCRPGEEIMMEEKNHEEFSSAKSSLSDFLKKQFEGRLFNRNYGWAAAGLLLFVAAFWGTCAAVVAATYEGAGWQVGVVLGSLVTAALLWLVFHQSMVGKCLLVLVAFIALGIAFVLGMPIVAEALSTGWILPLALPALAFPLVVSAFWWIAAPTPDGRKVLDHIAGFRQYLSITEAERLDRMTPPNDTPALFERYLPYAIALGVENRWAKRFEGVLAAAAAQGQQGFGWYAGSGSPWNNPTGFVTNVGSSLASTISSASTAPGSSSGSGGGGSSGGGGGGGGGGGW